MPYANGPEWYEINLRQKEAMTPDTAPTPQEPSPQLSSEPVNDASGTTWMGMRAAGWTWSDPAPAAFGGKIRKFATHWSTGPKDAERLYRESDVRALIAVLSPQEPSSISGGGDRELLAYVLQDEQHNRLTPRVIDIAYTAFMLAKQPNAEDGGSSDWFNDTRPVVKKAIEKLRDEFASLTPTGEAAP